MVEDWESKYGEHALVHNPGYDYMRLVKWVDEVDPESPESPFAPYILPVVSLLAACCCLEGYINMVGQRVDPKWEEFDKGPIPIRDRIERIYKKIGKTPNLGSGIWQEGLQLFAMRRQVAHPKFVSTKELRKGTIPTLFERVGAKYPHGKAKRIAEQVVDKLLEDAEVPKDEINWMNRGYTERPVSLGK